ncbi:MAG: CRISPR-associated endonuclease Cas2 [Deltaproteobacteria bacterium]|nr:MAG: CRISPR-associated endonuclease Cas2 [Deltaproteobacteria bacterium]
MSRNTVTYLIAYDITDPKRLRRIHRFMRRRAIPLQYSVFIASLTPGRLDELLLGAGRLIDELHDDVRCYALPTVTEVLALGRPRRSQIRLSALLQSIRWATGVPSLRQKKPTLIFRRRRRKSR